MPRGLHTRSPANSPDQIVDLPQSVFRRPTGLSGTAGGGSSCAVSSPVLQVRKPMASYGVSFAPVATVVHVLGVVILALILYWVIAFRGGLTLWGSVPSRIFNAHPVIMFGGFIFISSEAILVYKTVSGTKRTRKLVHLSLQATAFVLALIGIWAALKFHLDANIDNFYSLHSWLGVFTVTLFFLQWVIGFFSFWTQSVAASTRATVLPWHVYLGLSGFSLAIATAVTGLLEKITFLQNGALGHYASEAMFVNSIGLLVVIFGFVVVLAAVLPAPKEDDGYQPIE